MPKPRDTVEETLVDTTRVVVREDNRVTLVSERGLANQLPHVIDDEGFPDASVHEMSQCPSNYRIPPSHKEKKKGGAHVQ